MAYRSPAYSEVVTWMLAPMVGHPRKHGESSDSTNWIEPGYYAEDGIGLDG